MVEQIRHRPVQQCTVERLKPAFKEIKEGAWLKARIAAVETGLPQSMTETCQRPELDKVMATHVVESDIEESRTVEMYDMVAAVSTRSRRSGKLSVQLTAGQIIALPSWCQSTRSTRQAPRKHQDKHQKHQ